MALADGDWSAEVVVERHRPDGVSVRPFYGRKTYGSKDEALRAALEIGRRVVDGQVPGSSVDDL